MVDTFAKIYSDITESSLIMTETIETRYLFIMLCATADKLGVVNMTPAAMAHAFNMDEHLVLMGLERLMHPDEQSRTEVMNGVRVQQMDERGHEWLVVNKAKYYDKRNYDAQKQLRYRERLNKLQESVANADNFELKPAAPITPPYEAIKDLYNETLLDLDPLQALTDNRKAKMRKRWQNELNAYEKWRRYFERVADSDFLCGRVPNARWKANFDWLMQPKNIVKVYEGNYDV